MVIAFAVCFTTKLAATGDLFFVLELPRVSKQVALEFSLCSVSRLSSNIEVRAV